MPGPGRGPGPRGMKPTVDNPMKVFGRIMKYVFKNYLPHCIIVFICIIIFSTHFVNPFPLFVYTLLQKGTKNKRCKPYFLRPTTFLNLYIILNKILVREVVAPPSFHRLAYPLRLSCTRSTFQQ